MPHAILRVTHMTGITVREFYISGPEDLQRRVLSMFSGLGLQPQTNTGGEVKFEGEFETAPGGGMCVRVCRNGRNAEITCLCFAMFVIWSAHTGPNKVQQREF